MPIHLTKRQIYERGGPVDELLDCLFYSAVIMDKNAKILFINKHAGELTGFTQEEAIGEMIAAHARGDDWKRALAGETVIGAVTEIGGRKCLTSVYPIVDNGEIIGALGVIPYKNLKDLKRAVAMQESVELGQSREIYTELARVRGSYVLEDFIGENKKVLQVLEQCRRAAKTDHPILLIGETGCGKEILASGIHEIYRGEQVTPFVKINCTAIPHDLLESELFGHERGAFTGAVTTKRGKFELAENGTILLDEIGDMDLGLQGKLLRVLEEKEFERVGGIRLYPLKARIIASTNKDLWQLCTEGKFRTDLYYRLNIIEIEIPPLRKRREDVYLLTAYFLKTAENPICLTDEAYEALFQYDWPGNVRQLKNFITRLSVLYPGQKIDAALIRRMLNKNHQSAGPSKEAGIRSAVMEGEKACIVQALEANGYQITKTAKALGIGRTTLYEKMKKYKL